MSVDVASDFVDPEVGDPGAPETPNQPSMPRVAYLCCGKKRMRLNRLELRKLRLQLNESELRLLEESARPDWRPPASAIVLRELPEQVHKVAMIINRAYANGRRSISAAEVSADLKRLGWKQLGNSNSGVGDHLGRRGLQLHRVSITGGLTYVIPAGGITLEYLRSLGFDV